LFEKLAKARYFNIKNLEGKLATDKGANSKNFVEM